MSIARSHDRERIEAKRMRDVAAPASVGVAPTPDAKRPFRAPRRKLSASLRARVTKAVGLALGDDATPQTGAQIAQTALSLFRAGQRELHTNSPIALSHLLRWAIGTATAQYLALAAADADPASARGRELIDLSMRLEGRAERASVAALTFANVLRGRGGADTEDLAALIREGAKPRPRGEP